MTKITDKIPGYTQLGLEPNIEYELIYNDTPLCGCSWATMDDFVGDMPELQGYSGKNIKKLLEKFGGKIKYFDPWTENKQEICCIVHGRNNFETWLPNHHGPITLNMFIAKDIGHFILHTKYGEKPSIFFDNRKLSIYYEAIGMAYSLLLPKEKFIKSVKNNDNLKAKFLMSNKAIMNRMSQFKIMNRGNLHKEQLMKLAENKLVEAKKSKQPKPLIVEAIKILNGETKFFENYKGV